MKGILSEEWHGKGHRHETAWGLPLRVHNRLLVVCPGGVKRKSQGSYCQGSYTPHMGIWTLLCWLGESYSSIQVFM